MNETDFKTKTIGIIGGLGSMGTWFKNYFTKKNFKVEVSDLHTELTNRESALRNQIIILSTPMEAAESIIEEIGPDIPETSLVMDICSLKKSIMEKMLLNTKCQVLGCHPMFGQYTRDLKKQNMIFCPGRGSDYIEHFTKMFQEDGAEVTISSPEKHDKYMALVQGITHILTIATGEFIKKEKISPEEILNFSTPVFKLNLELVGRLFGLDISLYKDLIGRNPENESMIRTFIGSLEKSLKILTTENENEKMDFLREIKSFMGSYAEDALMETNELFNYMYK